jgi:hypothetical protein
MSPVKLSQGFKLAGGDDSKLEPDPATDDWYVKRILDNMPPNFPVVRRVIDELFPKSFRIEQEVSRILADLVRVNVLRKTRDVQRHTDFFERVTTEKQPYRI